MRMRVALEGWNGRLLAALSLAPIAACSSSLDEEGGIVRPCSDSQPYTAAGQASGYEQCAEGYLHRPVAQTCASTLPRPEACPGADEEGSQCTTDADCTDQPHGVCGNGGGNQAPGCFCYYGCVDDSECGAGQICLCGDPVGGCVQASCTTDDDCEGDALCAPYITEPGCGGTAFACQSPADECSTDEDCDDSQQCSLEGDHRVCAEIECAIGRPFLVDGSARVASVVGRRDFAALDLRPRLEGLSMRERESLAARWAEIGQMEHASIAAFARFALQLLSLGAPSDLLESTHAAMADETAHARSAFGLASAYGERAVGPGPLSLEAALDGHDVRAILEGTIVEGCVGETVAAVEAAEAAAHADDPVVGAVLRRIAEDETRHAELAWRFVDWLLARDASLAPVARRAFAEAMAIGRRVDDEDEAPAEIDLLRHGVIGARDRCALRARVIRDVLRPLAGRVCARAETAAVFGTAPGLA